MCCFNLVGAQLALRKMASGNDALHNLGFFLRQIEKLVNKIISITVGRLDLPFY